ncbi:hypothetical protein PAXRUDRAFT_32953 [Paxillus rubicundulus Ve08.2h10]|uniref:Unplaced genomic scaffold scaffold_217, whole genome shotgun sequence n=1 Tax=Paxillus rubicundulus Ve08.2h10 TaxID=930991 RepID=A0A0D0DRD4_9AGAM|nr:hypothetical protein PAXRUDRAFT_32953 [Paxillus rubicundulus Ve08.2h10]
MTSFNPVDGCRHVGHQQELGASITLLPGLDQRTVEHRHDNLLALKHVDTHGSCPWQNSKRTNSGPGHPAPISGIPAELLMMILTDVVISESSSCMCKFVWVSSPKRLAAVSRKWRAAIFSCPALWTHVHVTPYQSVKMLNEHLLNSSRLPIHVTVHQWPFRDPIPTSGPLSIAALTAQLYSILSQANAEPICGRVQSLTINATESNTFVDFVLQTWSVRGLRFPVLRHVSLSGGLRAIWSRSCFFDGKNAPALETLELKNIMVSCNVGRLSWGVGLNLTTLVWKGPAHHDNGSLVIPVTLFHKIVASLPSLTTLELHGHAVGLEHATLESLASSGVLPLTHIKILRASRHAFINPNAAFMLFLLLPSLTHALIRGHCCSGPLTCRTATHAIRALIDFPRVPPSLEDVVFECLDENPHLGWREWVLKELDSWKERRKAIGESVTVPRVRMRMLNGETLVGEEGRREACEAIDGIA